MVLNQDIAIVGTGAIGSFYGLQLQKAGYRVHFIARNDYETLQQNGMKLQTQDDVWQEKLPFLYSDFENVPRCDWVLVCTKSTANADLVMRVPSIVKRGGRVLVLQNGLGVEDEFRAHLPSDAVILGGLCFVCAVRIAPGVIDHQGYGKVQLGYHSGVAEPHLILKAAQQLFQSAGIETQLADSLMMARWQKLVWNIPFNGLSAILKVATNKLVGNKNMRALVERLMNEVLHGAGAQNLVLPSDMVKKMLVATDAMGEYFPSMYWDAMAGRPIEWQAIYERPVMAAKNHGVEMPQTQLILDMLRFKYPS